MGLDCSEFGATNLDAIAATVFGGNSDGLQSSACVNVVVQPDIIEANMENKQMVFAIINKCKQLWVFDITNIKVYFSQAAGIDCIVIEYDLSANGYFYHQKRFIIPGRTCTYIVSTTCLQSALSDYAPDLNEIINTMHINEGISGVPIWARYVCGGAILGALYGLYKTKSKRIL
jgi:hypothetical protein